METTTSIGRLKVKNIGTTSQRILTRKYNRRIEHKNRKAKIELTYNKEEDLKEIFEDNLSVKNEKNSKTDLEK